MKKILFILMLATVTINIACSKNNSNDDSTNINSSQVPSAVVNAFNSRYPSAGGQIEWEKENGNTYKVKFFISSQRWQAIFDANGNLISEKKI
jgi:hypothetical protein